MHLYDSRVGEFFPRATSGQIADALLRNLWTYLHPYPAVPQNCSQHSSLGADYPHLFSTHAMQSARLCLQHVGIGRHIEQLFPE